MDLRSRAFTAIAALTWAAAAGSAVAARLSIASAHGAGVIRIEDDASRFSVQ